MFFLIAYGNDNKYLLNCLFCICSLISPSRTFKQLFINNDGLQIIYKILKFKTNPSLKIQCFEILCALIQDEKTRKFVNTRSLYNLIDFTINECAYINVLVAASTVLSLCVRYIQENVYDYVCLSLFFLQKILIFFQFGE